MKLSLVGIDKDGVVRIAADGPITGQDYHANGKNPMEAILGEQWAASRVLLDLHKTPYVDSSAVGWLLDCHKKFTKAGGTLVLHSIPRSVRQILDLLKIGLLIPLMDDEPSAKAKALAV